jgi:hypothetical protein
MAGDELYESAVVRVDEWGLRFTGQWQGALVIEIYKSGEFITMQIELYPKRNIIQLTPYDRTGGHPKLPKPKDVPAEISCDFAAKTINDWTKICGEHTECNSHNPFSGQKGNIQNEERKESKRAKRDYNATYYPKRLIELGKDVTTARLVPYPIDSAPPYAALSYCWGGERTFKTSEHTEEKFKKNIPLDELPQTLKDAFSLTKKIELDYLWVDAICIIQGNQAEWEQESRKMGRIYSNAKIVLSPTSSAHVNEGIFIPRPTPSLSEDIEAENGSMCARRNINHEIITSCRTKSDKWWETNINKSFPVLSRGWCFLERLLATRIVHFTPTELVWECQNTRKCECRVVESNLYPALNSMSSALRLCLTEQMDERGMRQMWREIVRSYSVRKLTKIEDKLPALSGIAALLKGKSGDMYAAGLWRRSLPFDLLWRCDQSGALKSRKERVPSWSWISVDGAVKWPASQQPDEEQPLKYITSTTYFEYGAEGVEICDVRCKVQYDKRNEFGQVTAGRLKLRTRLVPATIHRVLKHERVQWVENYGTEWAVQVDDSDMAPVWPDINEEGLHYDPIRNRVSRTFYVMEVMKEGAPGTWEEALVIRLKEGSNNEYERVGVAANVELTSERKWITPKSWFNCPYPDHPISLV